MAFKGTVHDLALDGSMKAYKEKAFFTDPYIFCHDSCEWRIDLELGGWEVGVKKWLGELLVRGLKKPGRWKWLHTMTHDDHNQAIWPEHNDGIDEKGMLVITVDVL